MQTKENSINLTVSHYSITEELKESFTTYKNIFLEAKRKYDSMRSTVDQFDSPNPNITQSSNVPGLDEFVNNNREQIEQVGNIHNVMNKILNDFIEPAHANLLLVLGQINIDQMTDKIVMREKSQDEIFETINERIGEQFNQFDDKVVL